MRTPKELVRNLRAFGRTDDQIRSIARATRKGEWLPEVNNILTGGGNESEEVTVAAAGEVLEELEENTEVQVVEATVVDDEEPKEPEGPGELEKPEESEEIEAITPVDDSDWDDSNTDVNDDDLDLEQI